MRSLLFLLLTIGAASCALYRPRGNFRAPRVEGGETWALIVAGSSGWYNYRHQSDVAHAYHVLRNHGISEERIVTMMYDDIANNNQNPFKGKLFNKPYGEDVYSGLNIDYKKDDVTPENFLNVLKGNKTGVVGGNGRVIESQPEDRIFVYFSDHGAVGLISFPEGKLTVKELNDALKWMYKNNRYSQLVFYLEACESGSMFENILQSDLNIYAVTAANSHESSYACYCDNDMNLPCLGDSFSVNWMEHSDKEDLNVETLESQYEIVKEATEMSHVMQYGNLTIAQEPVGWFQGVKRLGQRKRLNYIDDTFAKHSSWSARDVELFTLMKQKESENDLMAAEQINKRIRKIHEMRRWVKERVHEVVDQLLEHSIDKRMFAERNPVININCHHHAATAFHAHCVNLNQFPYGMKYIYVVNNLCVELEDTEIVVNGIKNACIGTGTQRFAGEKFY